ncbi:MAG: DUF2164 domain-containing protein [Methanomassiliicoccus sp.]|nr:DUF2164 domain-containing protein [Methanomassiliicoccus sp.]
MKKDEKLTLSKEKRDVMVSEIKRYFLKEREEEIGDLAAGLLLNFIADKIAPEFYNKGVNDAYGYMSERLEEMLEIQR